MKSPTRQTTLNQFFRVAFCNASFCFCLFALPPFSAWTAVNVSGPVTNETWTQANSPYNVVGNVQVSGLTIEAGVMVHLNGNYVFEVSGVLTAIGTEAMPILFTQTNGAGGWQGVFFNTSAPGSVLEHCRIEGSIHSGVRITNSLPVLRRCRIANNSSPGSGGGICADIATGDLVLEDCIIVNNTARFHGGGVYAFTHAHALRMTGCTVAGNIANPTSSPGTSAGGGIHVVGNSVFNRCVIADNICSSCAETFAERHSYGGGLYSSAGRVTLRNCLLKGNQAHAFCSCGSFTTCRAFGGGLYLDSGELSAINTIVLLNEASGGSSSTGGGIHVAAGSASVQIVNCNIAYNDPEGLSAVGGSVAVRNSILFFNDNSGTQISGVTDVTYSDVEGGFPGTGNKNVNPAFASFADLRIVPGSPCTDMGDPAAVFNDACFPPSLGTVRNDMGAHGGPGGCCWMGPCPAPEIQAQPQDQAVCIGREAAICVSASGDEPLSFQWRFNGVNIPGATNACHVINPLQLGHAGDYSVLVCDSFGVTASSNATLTVITLCVSIDASTQLTINGVVGQTYRIEYVPALMESNQWIFLTNLFQASSTEVISDPTERALRPSRFYRIFLAP